MLQPCKHNLLACLLNLARKEHLVEDGVDLVKVEDEIELADVAEEGVEDFYEEVNRLEESELVVVSVDAGAEEQPRVPPVDDLVVAELDKVGLVFLVARSYEAVDLDVGGAVVRVRECEAEREFKLLVAWCFEDVGVARGECHTVVIDRSGMPGSR